MDNVWLLFLPAIICFALPILGTLFPSHRIEIEEHHEKSWKLTNKGADTSSLKAAKDCLYELTASYESISRHVNNSSRSCYEDDIELIRSNAEALAEDEWDKKATAFLLKISQAYDVIANPDFHSIEKAYKSKDVLITAYDDIFDWTRQCYEENRDIWKEVNLWDMAKEAVGEILAQYDHYVLWDERTHNQPTVRQQLIETLDDRIKAMRPEYQRKMKLRSLILQEIADQEAVQRSRLLNMRFNGFVSDEVNACYKGLIREHAVIEYKQGSVYFVVLSDAVTTKYPRSRCAEQDLAKEKPRPKRAEAKEETEDSMIAASTKLIYKELIRHFGEEGIEYVDKTASGGSLYFFSDTEAENLKSKDYHVFYAEKGTKGTEHRPAWYIKL